MYENRYVDCIEDCEELTKEELVEYVNEIADKLNTLMGIVYNSSLINDEVVFNDLINPRGRY